MPGIVVFRRRWRIGSDDLVVPGAFLFIVHLIWTIILAVLLGIVSYDRSQQCILLLWGLIIGYLIILLISMTIELLICIVAMRGSILNTAPRASMQYILYFRVAVMMLEGGWLSAGIAWLIKYYTECPIEKVKEAVLGMVVWNWCILVSVLVTVWCTYDSAGRSWVKMKNYQRSMRASESKFQYKRSGSTRNWRQRKVIKAYQDSWNHRCRLLFCFSSQSDRNRNSFADIARLLSDFFRDLDVVPSDVVAGLVLLRKFQKIERTAIVEQRKNDTYEFLSGVPITPRTQFLCLNENNYDYDLFQSVIHYAHYAISAYGWPVYVMTTTMGICKLCTNLQCCCCGGASTCCFKFNENVEVVQDNCCKCNYAALQKLKDIGDIDIIYATYHVDVGETPFFVALDYDRRKVVISVRGTLSMKDILTDLNAEGEPLPLDPPREDWLGHKGMVQAAQYIYNKLREENLIERALQHRPDRNTPDFQIVIVGHSLGAGTASILGILLRQFYPTLKCYCYSPPGGLLSMPAVEYTKNFTISVVIGKDVVPRIGLHQMEALRADLINAIMRSVDPKWKTITCSIVCCGCSQPTSAVELSTGESNVGEYMRSKLNARSIGIHPSDSTIALTSHQPLYPPGRIIHVVRHHPTKGEQALSKHEPVFQALWAENTDFDEVLISPVMIQDHMPDKVMDALTKVVTYMGPRKPQRTSHHIPDETCATPSSSLQQQQQQQHVFRETSFTSLQSPSGASSLTNGFHSALSHVSPSVITTNGQFLVKSLSLTLRRTPQSPHPVDLIHDDWFGLAPLASPESLSEVSSISSRASLVAPSTSDLLPIITSSSKTPKIMRRTPKIIGSLSTCADDIRNVRNFQMAKIFRRMSNNNSPAPTNSSSNLSYESAASNNNNNNNNNNNRTDLNKFSSEQFLDVNNDGGDKLEGATSDEFQSAEDILDNVLASAGCKDFFNSSSGFLETHFDLLEESGQAAAAPPPPVRTPTTPQEMDPDLISNLAIDLNLDEEHRSIHLLPHHHSTATGSTFTGTTTNTPTSTKTFSKPNSIDSGSVCRTPSDTKNVTFNPQVINIDSVILEPSPKRSWCLFRSRHKPKVTSVEHAHEIQQQPVPPVLPTQPPKTILCMKRRNSGDDDGFFARTEQLPLLTGLSSGGGGSSGGTSDRTSPNFVRRKKYVYPSDIVVGIGKFGNSGTSSSSGSSFNGGGGSGGAGCSSSGGNNLGNYGGGESSV